MKIKLSPVRMDERLIATVDGDIITLNDEELDFSPLEDGDILPSSAIDCIWIHGDVTRIDGDIHITLVLPHGASASEETRFPDAYEIPMDIKKGEIPLPPYDTVLEDA